MGELISKLTSADYTQTLNFLKNKAAENLFIIGDIENFGFDQDFQELWGDFDDTNTLKAVLLRYYGNYIAYAPEKFDAKGFADIINKDQNIDMLSGIKEMTEQISPFLNHKIENRELYYAKCTEIKQNVQFEKNNRAKKATVDDADRIIELRKGIPEFQSSKIVPGRLEENMKHGFSRTYYIEEDHAIVSAASTTAENKLSAMVVAVCTLERAKKKGYATECITALCNELIGEGKECCLFYDNPAAGSIYKKVGFEDIGIWVMGTINK